MKNLKLKIQNLFLLLIAGLAFATPAFAHVSVKPNQVGVGAFQTFSVGVPNEKDNPTISLRVVIPHGLEHVSPNVKPGWNIEIKHEGESMKGPILNTGKPAPEHDETIVTEIIWTGGSIPAGQRDEFMFNAKAPVETGELIWKAYQTYSDGVTVAWDLAPDQQPKNAEGEPDFSVSGPYSTTKVINDLTPSPKPTQDTMVEDSQFNNLPLILSLIAVILGGFALWRTFKKV